MTGNPPFECGPKCPAPDHHEPGQRIEIADNPTIHAAAVADTGYRDLAAMGPESVMTEPEPCGYPGDLEPEAGT